MNLEYVLLSMAIKQTLKGKAACLFHLDNLANNAHKKYTCECRIT